MNYLFTQVMLWSAVAIVAYGIIATLLALWTILKRRDELYRAKYEEFLRQKHHVEDILKRSRENAS